MGSPWAAWPEICTLCHRTWSLTDLRWRCTCGGLLDLLGPPPGGAVAATRADDPSPLVRYGPALPPGAGRVDLGMAMTPVRSLEDGVFVKLEFEHPTGSFKDRGAAVMIGTAAALGVDAVVVDSSGNAGRAAAAHAARAGIACTVFVPAGTAEAKRAAMAASGARVVEVGGDRAAAAAEAQSMVDTGRAWYASHVHQPVFHHGVKTLAFELAEQVPDLDRGVVVVPAGNGTLVLGLWLGFAELVAAGRLARPPKLLAVQADRCAPLAGWPPSDEPTAAAGIAIADPPRAGQVRAAVAASGGAVVVVGEEGIRAAGQALADMGLDVEPTGAVAWAAVSSRPAAGAGRPVVAVLTGR